MRIAILALLIAASAGAQIVNPGGGGGGGATIPSTTNVLIGDGSGNAANSGISAGSLGASSSQFKVFPYTAFGDSITYGYESSSLQNSYPAIIGKYLGIAAGNVNDLGNVGSTSNSNDVGINSALPTIAQNSGGLTTYTIGTNNVTAAVAAANTSSYLNFGLNVNAQLVEMAIPQSAKVFASAMTRSSGWSSISGFGGNAYTTSTSGSTITFSVSGSVIYVVTYAQGSSAATGSASMTCDGNAISATLNFTPAGGVTETNGNFTALTRVSSATGLVGTGTHSCVITSTSTGAVGIVMAAGLSGSAQTTYPYVIAGAIIPRNPDTGSYTTYAAQFRTQTQNAVTQMATDGLNASYVDTTAIVSPNAATGWQSYNYTDALHPNDTGYCLMAQTFFPQLRTNFGLAGVTPPACTSNATGVFGNYIANNALYGAYSMSLGYTPNTGTGAGVTTLGGLAGNSLTTGSQNTFLGHATFYNVTSGSTNVGIGDSCGFNASTISQSVCIGSPAMNAATTAMYIAAGGYHALNSLTTGQSNACWGFQCLPSITTTNNNSGLGANSGTNAITSTHMTFLGNASSQTAATVFTNSTALGDAANVTASNQVVLGASTVTQVVVNGIITGLGTAPTIAAGAAAGTTPTVSFTGSNLAGVVNVTTGTSPTTGVLATITFNGTLTTAPQHCSIDPANAATPPTKTATWTGTPTTTTWTLNTITALTASTAYSWGVSCF